jgi:hypothetical protein
VNPDGKIVFDVILNSVEGAASINVSKLKIGVYMLRAGRRTFQFIKK